MREKCVARGRDDGGSCTRQEKARYREKERERVREESEGGFSRNPGR